MNQITLHDLQTIKGMADGHGIVRQAHGDPHSLNSLSAHLARHALNTTRLISPRERKAEVEYKKDIAWLVKMGYIQIRYYPFRFVLTKLYSEFITTGSKVITTVGKL